MLVGHFIFETKVHLFETQELKPETMSINQKPGDDEDGSEFTDQQSNIMSEDDSSFAATMDQPKMVRTTNHAGVDSFAFCIPLLYLD